MVLHGTDSGNEIPIACDGNGNIKCNVVSALPVYPHGSVNGEGSPTTSFNVRGTITNTVNTKLEDLTSSLNADHVNCNKSISVKTKITYENLSLAEGSLNVYGSDNGASIDMSNHRHVAIKIRMAGTGGLSSLQNLKVYYSLDDTDFVLGEVITLNELPGSAGNYQGFIVLKHVGFKYVRLFSVGVSGSPTNYYIHYNRFN